MGMAARLLMCHLQEICILSSSCGNGMSSCQHESVQDKQA